jgi:hypothetical protein
MWSPLGDVDHATVGMLTMTMTMTMTMTPS